MKIFMALPIGNVRDTFYTERSIAACESVGEVVWNPYDRQLTEDKLIELAQDCDVVMTGWGTPKMCAETVKKMPNLKMIAHTAGSVAYLLNPDIYDCGIQVIGANDVFARSVAEATLAYTFCGLRQIELMSEIMRSGGWKVDGLYNRGLFYKKVGIVGFGAIARHFLELIRWFKCDIRIYSSYLSEEEAAKYGGRLASLEEIFSECDVVSIHSSMTPKNAGLVTRDLLSKLRPDSLLVNTARGGVIDEPAMFEMLMEGRFNAVLDVYAEEPPRADNPIRQCKNALLMPHVGGPTIDMREVCILELCEDLARFQKGEPMLLEIPKEQAMRMTR